MTAVLTPGEWADGRLALRSQGTVAVVWAAVFAILMLFIVGAYESFVRGGLIALEKLASNPAIKALFGEPTALDTPGGFAVWRLGTFLAVTAGVVGLLGTTRLLRGEEEKGRLEPVLAGVVRRPRIQLVRMAVVMLALAVVGLGTAIGLTVGGVGGAGAWLLGAAVAAIGWWFAAVGALAAACFERRRRAAAAASGVLGLLLLLRMLADGSGTDWLRWCTPFGWFELARPFAGNNPWPILLLVVSALVVAAAAMVVGRRLDVGAAVWRSDDRRAPRLGLLDGHFRFGWRSTWRSVLTWGAGLGLYSLMLGLLSRTVEDFVTDPANVEFLEFTRNSGLGGYTTIKGFVASLATFQAIVLAFYAVARADADAEEEETHRLETTLSLPTARPRWLGARQAVAVLSTLAVALVVGLATWAGVALSSGGLGPGQALLAVVNVLPVALLAHAVASLAFGTLARYVTAAGLTVGVGGFVVYLIASLANWPQWVRDLSPFSHLALAPSRPVAWVPWLVMVGMAVAGWAVAHTGFARRDVR